MIRCDGHFNITENYVKCDILVNVILRVLQTFAVPAKCTDAFISHVARRSNTFFCFKLVHLYRPTDDER